MAQTSRDGGTGLPNRRARPIRVSNDSRRSLLGEQSLRRDPARLARGIDLTKNPKLYRAIDKKVNPPPRANAGRRSQPAAQTRAIRAERVVNAKNERTMRAEGVRKPVRRVGGVRGK